MTSRARQPVFCTACGEQLEEFCFSPDARDIDALRAHAFRCHLEGRNTGGMCAKLYIADDAHPAQPGEPERSGPQPGDPQASSTHPVDEESLRHAIMARIVREGDGAVEGPSSGQGPSV
jgi:hypothetical protein